MPTRHIHHKLGSKIAPLHCRVTVKVSFRTFEIKELSVILTEAVTRYL